MKIKECCTVESQECIAKGIYSMWISTKVIAKEAKAGQFISLFSKDGSRLLPRPISLCEIDREGGRLRIVYRVAGAGTEEFSHLKAGDEVDILGPLGNGFPIEEGKGKRVMLMGGGIGVPPMLQTAKDLGTDTIICCGYRDELFLNEEFAAAGDLHIATEDGSAGVKGNVMDAVREDHLEADVILPAVRLRCCVRLRRTVWKREFHAGFRWKRRWRAALAHVLRVSASRLRWMVIHMCTTSGSARTDRSF